MVAESTSGLYQAIKDQRLDNIRFILQDDKFVHAPLFTSGSMAGYTILHVACMETNEDLVKMLIEEYGADVNIVAEDGTQPIHLACLFRKNSFVTILLAANADIEAEIGQDIFLKYTKDEVWCDDLGEKITILTYAVLYGNPDLADFLSENNANAKINSHTNKTLLMFALERNYGFVGQQIVRKLEDTNYINVRNNNGFYSLYFLFHPKKYGDFRYDERQIKSGNDICLALGDLLCYNPDIYATVNEDPATLLLNMVAYRSFASCLNILLPYYDHLKMSKALYYATLPPEDPQKTLFLPKHYSERSRQLLEVRLENDKKKSIELILKDLINRLTFGLPIPEEEKKLMDKLIATDEDIRELVYNYERNFIHGELKNVVIRYGDQSMTYYDLILRSADGKKLQMLVRDEIFIRAHCNAVRLCTNDHRYFDCLLTRRIDYARERIELLEELKNVEHLKKAIPLPYECILDIIEYLKNKELGRFIVSFYDI